MVDISSDVRSFIQKQVILFFGFRISIFTRSILPGPLHLSPMFPESWCNAERIVDLRCDLIISKVIVPRHQDFILDKLGKCMSVGIGEPESLSTGSCLEKHIHNEGEKPCLYGLPCSVIPLHHHSWLVFVHGNFIAFSERFPCMFCQFSQCPVPFIPDDNSHI